jgi:hypothetical protein
MRCSGDRIRCVAPGKVLVIAVDEGEIVGLEIGDPVARLCAHDLLLIDAQNVARSDELDQLVDGKAVASTVAERHSDR